MGLAARVLKVSGNDESKGHVMTTKNKMKDEPAAGVVIAPSVRMKLKLLRPASYNKARRASYNAAAMEDLTKMRGGQHRLRVGSMCPKS